MASQGKGAGGRRREAAEGGAGWQGHGDEGKPTGEAAGQAGGAAKALAGPRPSAQHTELCAVQRAACAGEKIARIVCMNVPYT